MTGEPMKDQWVKKKKKNENTNIFGGKPEGN